MNIQKVQQQQQKKQQQKKKKVKHTINLNELVCRGNRIFVLIVLWSPDLSSILMNYEKDVFLSS